MSRSDCVCNQSSIRPKGLNNVDEDMGLEEGNEAKGVRKPYEPKQEEIDEHMLTHVPYRSWCKYCVKARGRADAHKSQERDDRGVTTVHMDYAYLNEDDERSERRPILVMKDEASGKIIANMVPKKGENSKAIVIGAREI